MKRVEASESFNHWRPTATAWSIAEPVGDKLGWMYSSGLGREAHLVDDTKCSKYSIFHSFTSFLLVQSIGLRFGLAFQHDGVHQLFEEIVPHPLEQFNDAVKNRS